MLTLDKSSLSHSRNQSSLNWLLKTPGIKPAWPGLSRTESIWCIMMEQLGSALWNPSQFSFKWDQFRGRKSRVHYPQLEGCDVCVCMSCSSGGHDLMFRICHILKHSFLRLDQLLHWSPHSSRTSNCSQPHQRRLSRDRGFTLIFLLLHQRPVCCCAVTENGTFARRFCLSLLKSDKDQIFKETWNGKLVLLGARSRSLRDKIWLVRY